MRFITENDLRKSYQNTPFTIYEIEQDTKITPGARQFLIDKGIRICEKEKNQKEEKKEECQKEEAENIYMTKIQRELLSISLVEASFLKIGLELLEEDVLIAQEIFLLEQYLSSLKKESLKEELILSPCMGITDENFSECLSDCFEITGFHAQSKKGREIVNLHYLRCLLREMEPKLSRKRKDGVHKMINRLSQMICLAFGGKTCQKIN